MSQGDFQSFQQPMNMSTTSEQRVSFAEVKQAIAGHSFGQVETQNYRRGSATGSLTGSMGNQVVRKVVHFENPRKYINFDYKTSNNQYGSQQISYGQESSANAHSHNLQQSTMQQQQTFVSTVSQNPAYRFRLTNELDVKYQFEKESMQEELLRKVERLEQAHYEEMQRIQSEFIHERNTWTQKQETKQEKFVVVQSEADTLIREELSRSKEQVKVLQESVSTLEAEVSGLKQVVAEKNGHIDRFSDIETRLQELIVSKEAISSSYEELKRTSSEQLMENRLTIVSLEQKQIYLEKETTESRSELVNVRQKLTELEGNSTEVILLRESNSTLKRKVEKSKALKELVAQLREQIASLESTTKEQQLLIVRKTEELTQIVSSHSAVVVNADESELNDLRLQNQFLINELGRLTEENQEYLRVGRVVEKPVYYETVKNLTTIKEVPAKIEERIVYMQDKEQLSKLNRLISELQSELTILSQEKSTLIQQHSEEKNSLLLKLSQFAEMQSSKASVLREVIVERIVDRAEVNLKEEEIRRLNSALSAERMRIVQLQEEISSLTKELVKFQTQFKLVKLPNSYKIEAHSTASHQSQSVLVQQNQTFSNEQLLHHSGITHSAPYYRSVRQQGNFREDYSQAGNSNLNSSYSRMDGYETISRRVVHPAATLRTVITPAADEVFIANEGESKLEAEEQNSVEHSE